MVAQHLQIGTHSLLILLMLGCLVVKVEVEVEAVDEEVLLQGVLMPQELLEFLLSLLIWGMAQELPVERQVLVIQVDLTEGVMVVMGELEETAEELLVSL
tara:strand:+ start:501 stop:800 length:300 start_codon:yes stop_codon:yes gene_type:complete